MAKKPKQTKWVKKPDANFNVRIVDSPSIFANELEVIPHSSREAAYQTYRNIRKELGLGL